MILLSIIRAIGVVTMVLSVWSILQLTDRVREVLPDSQLFLALAVFGFLSGLATMFRHHDRLKSFLRRLH